ncbi:MAG: c-type cytochrome [Verrucomicrobiae bacterium]|nr:c-type cytochrome [Verrucomicrobiae bacterium]
MHSINELFGWGVRRRRWVTGVLAALGAFSWVPGADTANGVLRTITSQGASDVAVVGELALFVPAGEPATPLVPPGPFTARWEGFISSDLRAEYGFAAALAGEIRLTVNGTLALEAASDGDGLLTGRMVRLGKGPNPFRLEYTAPARGDAWMRLYWTNSETPLNPVPIAVLTPTNHPGLDASGAVRAGRDLVYEWRCVRCHGTSGTSPELSMDAPSFNGIGGRRQTEWMARWIANPEAMRPGASMPQLFHGAGAAVKSASVAAYLGTLKGPATEPMSGDTEAGRALFERFHCIACHGEPTDSSVGPGLVSQRQVRAKFSPGALAAFLKKPEEHYQWIRMPNFQLSDTEARDLASYLDSVADPAGSATEPPGDEQIAEGRTLVATSGCLNCHQLDGVNNEFSAAALADLPAAAWTRGCLAEAASGDGKAPRFPFGGEQRTALRAFASTDRSSLARFTDADFLDRQSRHLQCAACHGPFEGVPHWELLKGKLNPEWAARFIAGGETRKPRPWLEARMPGFPAYAGPLARGLATIAGHGPGAPADPVPPDASELAVAGQKLVSGNGGFACVSCHGVGDFAATQVFEAPGINLAYSHERLLPDFFGRWLRAPTSLDPESKMPVYFDEYGRSPLPDVLDGDGPRTISAIWEYLRPGWKAPRPE